MQNGACLIASRCERFHAKASAATWPTFRRVPAVGCHAASWPVHDLRSGRTPRLQPLECLAREHPPQRPEPYHRSPIAAQIQEARSGSHAPIFLLPPPLVIRRLLPATHHVLSAPASATEPDLSRHA